MAVRLRVAPPVLTLPLAAAMWLAAGCAARHAQAPARPAAYYELRALGRDSILIPPGLVARLDAKEILLRLPQSQRGRASKGAACEIRAGHFELRWDGSAAVIRVVPAWLDVAGTEGRTPVALANDLEVFRTKLAALETSGCVAPGAGLAQQIVERLPLPSNLAYFLRYGAYLSTGHVDADPRFSLKVVRPVRNERGEVDGFRTAYFRIEAAGGALRLVPRSLEEARRNGTRANLPPAPEPLLRPLETVGHLRLLFLTRASSADHDIALLGAADAAAVERLTPEFLARPEDFCQSPPHGVICVLAPRGVAVGLELTARANGQPVNVPLGATVGEILRGAGAQPEKVPPTLRVWRPFGTRLAPVVWDPGRRDILGLVLIGGEELRW